jgi:hypothetical protein
MSRVHAAAGRNTKTAVVNVPAGREARVGHAVVAIS